MHSCFICKHCAVVVDRDDTEAHFEWKCTGLDMKRSHLKQQLFVRPSRVIINKLSFSVDKHNFVC